jgi:hypothetical protein
MLIENNLSTFEIGFALIDLISFLIKSSLLNSFVVVFGFLAVFDAVSVVLFLFKVLFFFKLDLELILAKFLFLIF